MVPVEVHSLNCLCRVCLHLFQLVFDSNACISGAQKLARIRENSNFFRSELQKMGFEVLGDNDSPVMPIMLYNPSKIPAFSRECLKQNVSIITMIIVYFWKCANILFYNLQKVGVVINLSFVHKMQVAVVVVGFPATPLLLARARICISASHSREDLVKALQVGDYFFIKIFSGVHCTCSKPSIHAKLYLKLSMVHYCWNCRSLVTLGTWLG